jgi:UDP-glucose 4-epimerase
MRVLVTGGAGYIGSITVTKLINEGFEVTVLDDLSSGSKENLHPKAKFIEGSILDENALDRALLNNEIVIHLAAKSIVSESVQFPLQYEKTNTQGTLLLISRIKRSKIKCFIFASTAAVYGNEDSAVLDENSTTNPDNPYGSSKLNCEAAINSELSTAIFSSYVFRFFNIAGSYKNNGFKDLYENHNPETHLIPSLFNLTSKAVFNVYGSDYATHDGTCIRDYLHVLDVVDAFVLATKIKNPQKINLMNLGTGIGTSVLEVIRTFNQITNRNIAVKFLEKRDGDSASLVTNNERAEKILGWKAKYGLTEIIKSHL